MLIVCADGEADTICEIAFIIVVWVFCFTTRILTLLKHGMGYIGHRVAHLKLPQKNILFSIQPGIGKNCY
jgi:hypothetical protein